MKILYTIIWASSSLELSEKVNEQLNFGWKLQGGVGVSDSGGRRFFCQAMFNDDFIENRK